MFTATDVTLSDFYRALGLTSNPFDVFTTENEMDFIEKTFVQPYNYESIKNSFSRGTSMIVYGNRGTGKTAVLSDLINNTNDNPYLACSIDDYSSILTQPNESSIVIEYYSLILGQVIRALFIKLIGKEKSIRKLSKDSKLFLSYLLQEYTDYNTKNMLAEKIEKIQLARFKRTLKTIANSFRGILNYGAKATTNILNDTIRTHFSMLPSIDQGNIKDLFPTIDLGIDTDFNHIEASFRLLEKVCKLVNELGFTRVIIFFDKMDEDDRLSNDADEIAMFIKPLLTDNKLLLAPWIQLTIFVWEIPFNKLSNYVRTQKLTCNNIRWEKSDLIRALNKRLYFFSNSSIVDFQSIFSDEVIDDDKELIFQLSNQNPRDLWHILNRIFEAQYKIDSNTNKICKEAIYAGCNDFVLKFNFYEYYPRKSNARANTMDIYSYIRHLLKLSEPRFTKNQLNTATNVGSSIHNYVIGMTGLGLIKATDERIQNGIVYIINDPKVVYALRKGLDIRKP